MIIAPEPIRNSLKRTESMAAMNPAIALNPENLACVIDNHEFSRSADIDFSVLAAGYDVNSAIIVETFLGVIGVFGGESLQCVFVYLVCELLNIHNISSFLGSRT